ncbi:MAG: hypothetical protein NTZ21_14615 [Actinobacteria bacterium]|nr:hypothetical protein [Actinomycetota bacterium]
MTTYIARAEESESQVRVSIIAVTSPAEGFTSVRECGSDVETRTAVATLDAPLGSRDVINEATGFVEPIATETEDSRPSAVDPTSTAGGAAAATDELCASLVPGQYGFFQSLPTTVGEIRTVEGGPAPGSRLWPDALAGHADGDAAAWCQGKDAGNGYVFYVATFDGTMELLGRAHLLGTPKPGPLIVE